MKFIYTIIIFTFLITTSFSQDYKKVKIFINSIDEISELLEMGLQFDHPVITEKSVEVFIDEEDFSLLQQTGFNYEILIENWFEYYDALPKLNQTEKLNFKTESKLKYNVDGFDFGSMGGFYTYQEIIDDLDSMFAQFPDLITEKFSIGTSHEGRTIWAVKISDNPNISESEPAVGFDALIHAREPASMATLMYFMWYLLENYGTDPAATYLVNNREIFAVPCYNPDGYERNRQTNPNGGGMWRKNRLNSGSCYGVDLNRNYSYQWGYDNIGSSPDPCSDTYRGPSPISEPETEAVTNFINSKQIMTYFNMHSYQDAFLFPWGYINQACPDEEIYIDFCTDLGNLNGFIWGTGGQILGYNSNGSARDWLYGEQNVKNKIFGYTMEIGSSADGFWPQQSRIFPIAQNSLPALMYNAWVSGEYVGLTDPNFNLPYFNAGDNVEMLSVFKNKGLSDAENISVELTTTSSYVSISNGTAFLGTVLSRESAQLTNPLTFSISSSAPLEEIIDLVITTITGGVPMSSDTVSIIVGTPTFMFADTTNNPANLWTLTSNTSKNWEATTTSYHSAPNSYTDSRIGNYLSNSNVRMTLTESIDLSSYLSPRLTFWTKWDIEAGWDYAQVEISTNNGSSWIPLEGIHTTPGSGSFQPPGQPLYDGTQSSWIREEMDLTGLTSSQVKFRFVLRADGYIERDGWYVDDIGVIVYTAVPVELTAFTVNADEENVLLKWSTSSELNNNGFEIERAEVVENKNKLNYVRIGFEKGIGTSTQTTNYQFVDQNTKAGKYMYRLKQIDFDGTYRYYGPVEVEHLGVIDYSLEQNYPNPFNPDTKIKYSLPFNGHVTIKVYNVLGKEVSTLVNEQKDAGRYSVLFSSNKTGLNLSSGIYFYNIKVNDFSVTRKMLLIK